MKTMPKPSGGYKLPSGRVTTNAVAMLGAKATAANVEDDSVSHDPPAGPNTSVGLFDDDDTDAVPSRPGPIQDTPGVNKPYGKFSDDSKAVASTALPSRTAKASPPRPHHSPAKGPALAGRGRR